MRTPVLPAPARRSCTAVTRGAACGLAAAATLLLPSVARAGTSAGCGVSSLSATSQPACWRPFTPDSPFNTALPASPPLAPDSAAVQQHMEQYGWSLDGSSSGFTLTGAGTRPVYFATPSDPVLTVNCTDENGPNTCQGTNKIDVNGVRINVPAGAQPDGNWDHHMTVIETATGTEYDFWHASVAGATLTAGSGAEVDVNTGEGTGSGGDAANLALTAGLLRPAELASGRIDHALVITVPCTDATGPAVGYTFPALGGWGQYCGEYWSETASDAPMLGQRYQLDMTDAQIASSGAPVWEQTIMTALAHYGAYIEDTNGSQHYEGMSIITQDPASWTNLGQPNAWASVISELGGGTSTLHSSVPIPVSDLQLVNTCVSQGTCPTQAGSSLPTDSSSGGPSPTPLSNGTGTAVSTAPVATATGPGSTTATGSPTSTKASPANPPSTVRKRRRRRARASTRRAALRARRWQSTRRKARPPHGRDSARLLRSGGKDDAPRAEEVRTGSAR